MTVEDPLQIIYRLKKGCEIRIQALAINITSGGVDNMETYKYIIGQINALESVKQEISTLLDEKERHDGTIIDIKKPGNSQGVPKGSPKA